MCCHHSQSDCMDIEMYLRRYVQLVPIIGASEYKIRLYFSVCEIFVYKRAALEKIVSRKFV